MPRFKDRTGDKYGRLTVMSYAGIDHRNKHLWLCLCECGNEKIVVSDNLSSGKSNSCGCLKAEFLARKGNQYGLYHDREEALLKVQYSHLKRRDKKKGFTDTMSFEDFSLLSKSPCKYCGLEYSKKIEDRQNESKKQKRLSDHVLECNGIDRVDSLKGYTVENSVACCKYCNRAKLNNTEEYFKTKIIKIAKGIELEDKYFEIAKNRILEIQ